MLLQQCVSNVAELDPAINERLDIGVEIQDFASPALLDSGWQAVVEVYKQKLSRMRQIVCVHGPFMDLCPGSPDNKIAQVTKQRYLQSIEVAESLGASYIVFHSQINPGIKELKVKRAKAERQAEFWHDLLRLTRTDILMLLENFAEDDPSDLDMLVRAIGSPRVKVCLDVGHVLCNSSVSLERWMEVLAEHTGYVHLHWNDGSFDAHHTPPKELVERVLVMHRRSEKQIVLALEYAIFDIAKEVSRIREHTRMNTGTSGLMSL